jgi:Arm DNA-binding domain
LIVAKAVEVTRRLHVPDTITPQNRQRKREVRKPGSFTDRYIKSLKPDKEMYQLREGRGFAIRVLPSGVKTWYYIYTINGKRRQLNLGNYPDISLEAAHKTYLESAALVKSGIDPMAKPVEETAEPAQQEVELTVRRLAVDLSLDEWSKIQHSERWHYNNRKALEADVLPTWGDRLAVDIRRKDAVEILELVAKRAPGQARNVLKAARGMYSYAADRELLEYNPFADIKISRTIPMMQPMSRDRELSEDEIRHLWKAIDEGGGSESTKRALKLILVTGQRPGEVVGMHRREIQGKWWTIPWQRIKTRKRRQEDHRIYLTPLAMTLIGDEKEYIPGSCR